MIGELDGESLSYHLMEYDINGEQKQDILLDMLGDSQPERIVMMGDRIGVRANEILYVLEGGTVKKKVECPKDSTCMACDGERVLFMTAKNITALSTEDSSTTEELDLNGRNVVISKVLAVSKVADGYLFLSDTSDNTDVKVIVFSKSDVVNAKDTSAKSEETGTKSEDANGSAEGAGGELFADNEGYQTIYVYDATGKLEKYVTNPIDSFNEYNTKYQVVLRDYDLAIDENDVYSAAKVIAAGEYPDVILSPYTSQIDLFFRNGWLEYLTPYVQKSTKFSMDDLYDVVLCVYTKDNQLFALPDSISIEALHGAKEAMGDGYWSLEEFLGWMAEHPLAGGIVATRRDVYDACSDCLLERFIQWESGEAHFDNAEFENILMLFRALNRKDSYSRAELEEMYENGTERIGTAIVTPGSLARLENEMKMEMTVKGFPSVDGVPGVYIISPAVSIVASSKVKEGAFEFIEHYLEYASKVLQDNQYTALSARFYTLNSYRERAIEKLLARNSSNEEPIDRETIDEDSFTVTPQQVEKVDSMLQFAKLRDYSNDALKDIIWEEIAVFLDGQKDAAGTGKIIQNRVQLYLDEK